MATVIKIRIKQTDKTKKKHVNRRKQLHTHSLIHHIYDEFKSYVIMKIDYD